MTEADWERVAIIRFGCKVSDDEALRMYKRQLAEEKKHQEAQILAIQQTERIKNALRAKKLRRVERYGGYKIKSAGD